MSDAMTINIVKDTGTSAVLEVKSTLTQANICRAVGARCLRLTREHLQALQSNRRGWPTSGFWQGAARGSFWNTNSDGIEIGIDNEAHPGAVAKQFYGGTIHMKDRLLTIPARAEFYGKKATDFDGLTFVMFASGAKALVIREGGTGSVNFATGRSRAVKGAGSRAAGMVAYWLKDEVDLGSGNKDIIPSAEEYADTAADAVVDLLEKKGLIA